MVVCPAAKQFLVIPQRQINIAGLRLAQQERPVMVADPP
jgi:hypothetical protein